MVCRVTSSGARTGPCGTPGVLTTTSDRELSGLSDRFSAPQETAGELTPVLSSSPQTRLDGVEGPGDPHSDHHGAAGRDSTIHPHVRLKRRFHLWSWLGQNQSLQYLPDWWPQGDGAEATGTLD